MTQHRAAPDPAIAPAVLATLFVIAGEVVFFAGLVFGFWVLRLGAPVWPPPWEPRLPVAVTGANSVVLLASSVFMADAMRALRRGERDGVARRLIVAGILGGAFRAVQGYEWVRLVDFGLTVSSGTYGATFYTLVGAHAVHVLVALAWLAATGWRVTSGRLAGGRTAPVTACALYWHFVVLLWPILYVSVYLA